MLPPRPLSPPPALRALSPPAAFRAGQALGSFSPAVTSRLCVPPATAARTSPLSGQLLQPQPAPPQPQLLQQHLQQPQPQPQMPQPQPQMPLTPLTPTGQSRQREVSLSPLRDDRVRRAPTVGKSLSPPRCRTRAPLQQASQDLNDNLGRSSGRYGAASVSDAGLAVPYENLAVLSDSELATFAENALQGMVAPELLQRLSRPEIVSLLVAQLDMCTRCSVADAGRSNSVEPQKVSLARPGDAAGGGSPALPVARALSSLRHTASHEQLPRSAVLAPPGSWSGAGPSPSPPSAARLPKDAHQLRQRDALKEHLCGDLQIEPSEDAASELLHMQFSERVQKLLRAEDTLRQLAKGAQRLLQQAKGSSQENWPEI